MKYIQLFGIFFILLSFLDQWSPWRTDGQYTLLDYALKPSYFGLGLGFLIPLLLFLTLSFFVLPYLAVTDKKGKYAFVVSLILLICLPIYMRVAYTFYCFGIVSSPCGFRNTMPTFGSYFAIFGLILYLLASFQKMRIRRSKNK